MPVCLSRPAAYRCSEGLKTCGTGGWLTLAVSSKGRFHHRQYTVLLITFIYLRLLHIPRCFCPIGQKREQPTVFLHGSYSTQIFVSCVADSSTIVPVVSDDSSCTHASNATRCEQQD